MSEIFFDEVEHTYKTKEGEILPSVSQIIKGVGLSSGGDYVSEVMENAMLLGTDIHNSIQAFNDLGVIPTKTAIKGYFSAYLSWAEEYKPKVIESEIRMSYDGSPLKYAGTADLIAEIKGKKCIIDYKTGKSLYKYYGYQLAGYKKLYGEDVDIYILWLKPNGSFVYISAEFMVPNCVELWEDILVAYSKEDKFLDIHIFDTCDDSIKWVALKNEITKLNTKMKKIENKLTKAMKNNKGENEVLKYKYTQPEIKSEFDMYNYLKSFDDEALYTKEDVQSYLKGCFKDTVKVKPKHTFSIKK